MQHPIGWFESVWNSIVQHEESAAQWVMAVISIVATIVSIFAVWLLKGTLAATRDAVKSADAAVEVTREMGRIQVRAYLSNIAPNWDTVIDYHSGDMTGICFFPRTKNAGASPADIKVLFSGIRIYDRDCAGIVPTIEFKRYGPESIIVGSGDFGEFLNAALAKDVIEKIIANRQRVFLLCYAEYTDVFAPKTDTHVFTTCYEIFINLTKEVLDTHEGALPNGSVNFINRADHVITVLD